MANFKTTNDDIPPQLLEFVKRGMNGQLFTVGKYLSKGSYNRVHEATLNGKPVVFRYSYVPVQSDDLQKELDLTKEMSRLQLSPKLHYSGIFREGDGLRSFYIMDRGKSLQQTLTEWGNAKSNSWSISDLCKKLIDMIDKVARNGYLLSDIKPENIVVFSSPLDVKAIDFDKQFVGQNDLFTRFCQDHPNIANCTIETKTKTNLQILFFRLMIFRVQKFIEKYPKPYVGMNDRRRDILKKTFADALESHEWFVYYPKQLRIGGQVIPFEYAMKHMLPSKNGRTMEKQLIGLDKLFKKNFERYTENFRNHKVPKRPRSIGYSTYSKVPDQRTILAYRAAVRKLI